MNTNPAYHICCILELCKPNFFLILIKKNIKIVIIYPLSLCLLSYFIIIVTSEVLTSLRLYGAGYEQLKKRGGAGQHAPALAPAQKPAPSR